MHKLLPNWFLENTLFLPHMKHSYELQYGTNSKDTLALIEPRTASAHTLDGIPQDEIWHTLIVARRVTQWCSKSNSALVQMGNPSHRSITFKPNTIVATILPVTAIPPRTASAITHDHSECSQARIDLTAALDDIVLNLNVQRSAENTVIRPVYSVSTSVFINPGRVGKMCDR